MPLNRDNARRLTTRAEIGAVALLAVGGAVIGLPLPAMLMPSSSLEQTLEALHAPVSTESANTARQPELDIQRANSTLWSHGQGPITPAPEPPPAEQQARTPEPAETPPPPSGWRYLGSIVGPRTTHALLENQGRQHLVKSGGTADDVRVIEVHEQYVMISDRSGRRRLELAATDSSAWQANARSATVVGGRPGGPAARGNGMVVPARPYTPAPSGFERGMNEEYRRELIERELEHMDDYEREQYFERLKREQEKYREESGEQPEQEAGEDQPKKYSRRDVRHEALS